MNNLLKSKGKNNNTNIVIIKNNAIFKFSFISYKQKHH